MSKASQSVINRTWAEGDGQGYDYARPELSGCVFAIQNVPDPRQSLTKVVPIQGVTHSFLCSPVLETRPSCPAGLKLYQPPTSLAQVLRQNPWLLVPRCLLDFFRLLLQRELGFSLICLRSRARDLMEADDLFLEYWPDLCGQKRPKQQGFILSSSRPR